MSLTCAASPVWIRFAGGPRSITGVGDVDHDGRADFAVVAGWSPADPSREAWVCSGRDGRILWRFPAEQDPPSFTGSISLACDVDGDGQRDLAVSIAAHTGVPSLQTASEVERPFVGCVRVLSMRDGSLLRVLASPGSAPGDRFGYELADCGDVDGDGASDLLVGAPGIDRAFVFGGRDGKLRFELMPHGTGDFGAAVCAGADIDGDGILDFAVGAPRGMSWGFVELFSGKDGHRVAMHASRQKEWTSHRGRFGCALAFLPDVSGDGCVELVVGADGEEVCGRVHAFSGQTSNEVFEIQGNAGSDFGRIGTSLAVCRDLDADGFDDFVVADASSSMTFEMPRGQACGTVKAYSGKTREMLFEVFGDEQFDFLGFSVACVADLDGDGIDDIVARARQYFRAISGKTGTVLYDVRRIDELTKPLDHR